MKSQKKVANLSVSQQQYLQNSSKKYCTLKKSFLLLLDFSTLPCMVPALEYSLTYLPIPAFMITTVRNVPRSRWSRRVSERLFG